MEIDPPFKENLATAEDWRKALNRVVSAGVVLRITACRVSYATGFVADKHHPTRCHRPEQEIAQSRGSRNESITPSLRLLTAIVSLTKRWFATSGCPTLSCCVYRSQGRNSRLANAPYTEEQLRQLFRMFDRDGNGYITAAELAHSMAKLGHPLTIMEIDPPFKENLATAEDWRKALNRVVSAGVVLRITACRVSYATGFVVDKHHPTRCHRPEQEIAQSRGSRNESITPSLRLLTAIVSLTKRWFAISGCPTLSCCVYRSQGRNSRLGSEEKP
ncbi:hypothetical protein F0562_025543 [Nyssa sinensis]|uniref:EF-hand domain-containing protein n=1 Tax=Nyssa sinensis TaxID=561372 RepID=A0A5J5BCA9_9ASTE|nr:hypothetical protein F0562_025543 [Nyssa sinensis]